MTKCGPWAFVGGVLGFTGVAFGAFAAHAIADPQAKAWIDTGSRYQLAHTMTIFASLSFLSWGTRKARLAPFFFTLGCVLFCGSLYAMALGAPRWFGAITPFGGVSFLIGWAILAVAGLDLMREEEKKP